MGTIQRPPGRVTGRHATGVSPYAKLAAVLVLLATAITAGVGLAVRDGGDGAKPTTVGGTLLASAAGGKGGQAAADQPQPGENPASVDPVESGVPQTGPGTFAYAGASTAVLGTAGTLRRFQVGVENSVGQDVAGFATAVDAVLADQRSWIGGKDTRFQRVGTSTTPEITILLATPGTSEKLCAAAGLHTRGYTSCRVSNKVVINLARWLVATKTYGASIEVYRAYALNHEIGHVLGFGHEACPGQGKPAPVMLQQTLDLRGCVANAWVYVDGQRYSGTPIP